jgi:ABC-type bacteriocin/lantibiotic exporter with double-glycine peptidase domain
MKNIEIKQHDITDCGAACLASIAAHFGLKFPIARIRQYAFTDKRGTTVLGVIEVAKRLGFEAKGVKGPFIATTKMVNEELTVVGSIKGNDWEYLTMEGAPFFISKKPRNAKIGVEFH